jgi:hypothetical protein
MKMGTYRHECMWYGTLVGTLSSFYSHCALTPLYSSLCDEGSAPIPHFRKSGTLYMHQNFVPLRGDTQLDGSQFEVLSPVVQLSLIRNQFNVPT